MKGKLEEIRSNVCVVNIIIAIFAIVRLVNDEWLHFSVTDAYVDDMWLHNGVFSEFANGVQSSVSMLVGIAFAAVVIILIVSLYLAKVSIECEDIVAHIMFVIGVEASAVVGILYPLINIVVGSCYVTDETWVLVCHIALVLVGIIATLWGVLDYKWEEVVGKTDIRIIVTVSTAVVVAGFMLIPVLVKHYSDYQKLNGYRALIDKQIKGYDEEVGYQIGNYYSGTAVYADGKLFFVRIMKQDELTTDICSVDENGNFELVWKDDGNSWIWNIGYYDGYLYASDSNKLFRISTVDGTEEILIEGTRHIEFGIADGKLFYEVCGEDETGEPAFGDAGKCAVYYCDLNEEIVPENAVLYDDGFDCSDINHDTFVTRYLYRDSSAVVHSMVWLGDDIYASQSYEGVFYKINCHWYRTPAELISQTYPYGIDRESVVIDIESEVIESNVVNFNIFDNKIYYILLNDEKYYEAWCCDLDGQNKTFIGTIGDSESWCSDLSMADGYMVIEMSDNQGYLMQLEDGSIQKIY